MASSLPKVWGFLFKKKNKIICVSTAHHKTRTRNRTWLVRTPDDKSRNKNKNCQHRDVSSITLFPPLNFSSGELTAKGLEVFLKNKFNTSGQPWNHKIHTRNRPWFFKEKKIKIACILWGVISNEISISIGLCPASILFFLHPLNFFFHISIKIQVQHLHPNEELI